MIKSLTKMKLIRNLAVAGLGLLALTSCDAFKDDVGTCPKAKVNLTFTWNMDFIDKFQDDVHCIDVYVFHVVGTKALQDYNTKFYTYAELTEAQIKAGENTVDLNEHLAPGETLPEGKYIVVVHGGANCTLSSYDKQFDVDENLTLQALSLRLNESYYDNPNLSEADRANLEIHDSFFGIEEFEVRNNQAVNATIDLKRNTNKIHVSMYYKDGTLFNGIDDYSLIIIDDNNDLLSDNSVKPTGEVKYRPFSKEVKDGNKTHYSVFSVSRLVNDVNPELPVLTITKNGRATDDIAPIKIIEEIQKSADYQSFTGITSDKLQEYLDRNYDWYIEVALGEYNGFITADVTVKPWEVRNDQIDAF